MAVAKKAKVTPEVQADKSSTPISKTGLTTDTKRILSSTKALIRKKHGEESIQSSMKMHYEVVPTGSLKIDAASGIGGWPLGRILEVYGANSSGKTSLVTSLCAEAQKLFPDKLVAIIDVEQAFDPAYAQSLGLDLSEDRLLFTQPDGGTQALDIYEKLVESGIFSIVVLDSVAALTTDRELAADVGDQLMAEVPRLVGRFLKKLVPVARKTNTMCVFINQTRSNIGSYGGGDITTGGAAFKFYASMRVKVRKKDLLTKGSETFGQVQVVKYEKNKCGKPYQEAETQLIFNKGYDPYSEIVDVACDRNIIVRGGAWYTYPTTLHEAGTERIMGKIALTAHYENNLADFEHLKLKVQESYQTTQEIEIEETISDEDFDKLVEEDIESLSKSTIVESE